MTFASSASIRARLCANLLDDLAFGFVGVEFCGH